MKTTETIPVHVLNIGHGSHLFREGDKERERLVSCAREVEALHTIILGSDADSVASTEGHFSIYPTRSRFRVVAFVSALRLAFQICKGAPNATWVITSQDPFETGLVAYIVSRFHGKRFMVQEHGDFFSAPYWRRESLLNQVRFFVGTFLIRRAWRVRVVSERIKRTIMKLGVSESAIRILSVRSDTTAIRDALPDARIRAQFPPRARIILSAGRFVPQKNFPLLIRAFARIAARVPDAHVLLVGTGAVESRLRALVASLGIYERVRFLPWTDSFPSLLKSVDIYALSSNYEGWGRVLPEAMAAGLPIVTTDVGCVGELVVDGTHGKVVRIGDEEAFAQALASLLSDAGGMTEMGAAGKRTIEALPEQGPEGYAHAWGQLHTL